MTDVILTLDEENLNRIATGSLVGMVLAKLDDAAGWSRSEDPLFRDVKVHLRFSQTSLDWRRQHGGPDSMILVEYTPMCLAEGVLDLLRLGAEVVVEEELKK